MTNDFVVNQDFTGFLKPEEESIIEELVNKSSKNDNILILVKKINDDRCYHFLLVRADTRDLIESAYQEYDQCILDYCGEVFCQSKKKNKQISFLLWCLCPNKKSELIFGTENIKTAVWQSSN